MNLSKVTSWVIVLIFLFLVGFCPGEGGYKIGDKVKDFSLKGVDGKMVSLKSLTDAKGAIIVFSCNHCPFVVKCESRINAVAKKYKSKGFPLIAINSNDPVAYPEDAFDKMKERAKEKKFVFPYVVDETQEVAKTFGAMKTPHVYLLEKKGNDFVVAYIGAIDDSPMDEKKVKEKYLEDAIEALLAGKEIKTKETKAVGCGIKWKKA